MDLRGIEFKFTGVRIRSCDKTKKFHKFWNFFVSVNCRSYCLVSPRGIFWNTLADDLEGLTTRVDELGLSDYEELMVD